ncbi:hypothetical protein ACWC9R_02860 [Streptomyces sp. NPDC001219]
MRTTPHGGLSPPPGGARSGEARTLHKAARIVAADVGRYLRDEPLVHCANPGALRAG